MKKIFTSLLLMAFLWGCSPKKDDGCPCRRTVGLCVMATGNYLDLAGEMIASARTYFCKDHDVTYFLFTDGNFHSAEDLVVIPHERKGWPDDALMRFKTYDRARTQLASMDYLYSIDADMLFVAPVGSEIFADTVGCTRYVGKHSTYEKNKRSAAYLSKKKARDFFAGAFYGGRRESFFQVVRSLKKMVERDIATDNVSKLYDEAYLNRYFYDHPPQLVLNTSYCIPQDYDIPYEKKIIAVTKQHSQYQVGAQ